MIVSSHTHSSYKRYSIWIQTIAVYFLALWLDCFDFGLWYFEKLLLMPSLLRLIYLCRGVIRTLANIWNGEFWSISKQLLEIDYCYKGLRLGSLRESQLRLCCVVQGVIYLSSRFCSVSFVSLLLSQVSCY